MPNAHTYPKISIVTPNFNQGKFLEKAIRSVLSQGYPNLEYIIIDGGSTDNSVEIIKKYEDQLTYWVSEPDRGHGQALNKGFSRATGEIMAWINGDDMYLPWTFSVVAQCFNTHKDINWVTGYTSLWNECDQQFSVMAVYKNIYDFLLGEYMWIQQESTFWRRSLWEKAGGKINEQYKLMVDGELWCRFFLLDDLWQIDSILGGYREHSSNRVKFHYDEVINEMEMAISTLKNSCPERIKKRVRILKSLRMIRRIFKPFKVNEICQLLFKKFYEDINYKNLIFKDGSWIKARSEFKL